MSWVKRLVWIGLLAGMVTAIALNLRPQPVPVDVVTAGRGPLQVTINDDGRTRIRDKYVISTPLAGQLQRIHLRVGDDVIAGETVIARMVPTDPAFLDPRAVAQAKLRVEAAERRVQQAGANLNQAEAALSHARLEMERYSMLAAEGAATDQMCLETELAYAIRSEELRAAQLAMEIAEFERELEEAAFLRVQPDSTIQGYQQDFEIRAPITGKVLRVMQESSAVLTAGAPLVEIGDPRDLEVVVDVLSSDAVRIPERAEVRIEQWGGPAPLKGHVRLVEPAGFTRFSALGVEEQRVNVIIDFDSAWEERRQLGDEYRVEAAIIVWENQDCLKIPSSALFRRRQEWVVFVVENHRAVMRPVQTGQSSGLETEILSGIVEGETVIIHPSDQVTDGCPIMIRGE